MGKEEDVLDVRGVRDQHGQPVDSDTAAAGGRHAVFHGAQEVFVHGVGFPIALLLHLHLFLEPAALVHGIVQLGKRIGELAPAYEQLEPFGEFGVVPVPLGQGRDLHGIIRDEGRVHEAVLHETFEEFVDHLAPAQFDVHVQPPVIARCREFRGRHAGGVDVGVLADGVEHGQPRPGRGQVDRPALVRVLQRAVDFPEDTDEEALHQVHDVPVIHVGDIELQHGEFGVVRTVDPFVAEVVADLVHALHAAYDQPLEIEFVGDAHEERHVEGLVVGLEGPRQRASVEGLEDRGFHFDEPLAVHEPLDGPDEPGALEEDLLDPGVDDQVHVALPVPGLDVPQAVPFFGQGAEGLGKELQGIRHDGYLAGPGPEDGALDPQEIAYFDQLIVDLVFVRSDPVESDVDLDPAGAVEEVGEAGLAMAPLGDDPARHRDRRGGFHQGIRLVEYGPGGMGDVVADGVGIDAAGADLFELVVSLPVEIVRAAHPFAPKVAVVGAGKVKGGGWTVRSAVVLTRIGRAPEYRRAGPCCQPKRTSRRGSGEGRKPGALTSSLRDLHGGGSPR